MLTTQDKINYLNELIQIAEFCITSSQQAIVDYPNDDKAEGPTRLEFLSKQIALKEFYEKQIKQLTNI